MGIKIDYPRLTATERAAEKKKKIFSDFEAGRKKLKEKFADRGTSGAAEQEKQELRQLDKTVRNLRKVMDAENKNRDIARAKKDLAFIKEQNRIAPIRGDIDDIKEAKKKLKNLQGSALSRMAKTASKFGLSKLAGVGSVLNPTQMGMGAISENPEAKKMIEQAYGKKRGGKVMKMRGGGLATRGTSFTIR